MTMTSLMPDLVVFFQVIIIDISLAADNALVIGMAAAGLPPHQRHKAVLAGLGGAVLLRIILACFTAELLDIAGLTLAGGLLLLWVSWKMYLEIRHVNRMRRKEQAEALVAAQEKAKAKPEIHEPKKLSQAIWQILVADIGMSLDNVLGVAGAAQHHYLMLAFGLLLSIVLIGVAATFMAKMFHRWPWLAWLGIVVVLYVAINMLSDGVLDVHELMTGTRAF